MAPLVQPELVVLLRELLLETNMLRSVPGQVSLVLARAMEAPGQTGSSLAALSKELRAVWQQVETRQQVADPLDELRARRARRLAEPPA